MEILFIRHGETELNVADITHNLGDDTGLNDTGREQAEKAAEVCEAHGIKLLYSSPEKRARETAEIIGIRLNLAPIVSEKLAERNLGEYLGKPWPEIQAILDKMDTHTRYTFVPPNGESRQQMEQRLQEMTDEITQQSQNTAVVTHGGTLRGVMSILAGASFESSLTYQFHNASVTIFEYENGNFTERIVDDTSHLA